QAVRGLNQAPACRGSARRRNERSHHVVEAHQPDPIATAYGDVREHQARIESVVEVRKPPDLGCHQAPGVEHEEQVLIALELVFATDELLPACRRFPVERAVLVITRIVAQAFELALAALQPDRAQEGVLPIPAGQELEAADPLQIRIHAYRALERETQLASPERQRRGVSNV